ncbi:hypothetical protein A1Q2_01239 [Trichosporon asahii var. asahii CBS 8904]|uniref:Uncharacterized protein n=1 Tax=Trichosporon asahii var. asahii (strain CBS 8904) TaxID=1220162 RepID=K1W6B9_TRIAC|nr:hypothetical protein A1Q2_01239 [Trichosporon asahii var. asahii CBS 8904]
MHATAVLFAAAGLAAYVAADDNCNDKCKGYQTWMSSCAGYEPSGSGWSDECTSFCTDSKKSDQYKDCTKCLSEKNGQDAATLNGSLNRLCAQVSQVKSLSASASKTGKDAKKTDDKDKDAAGRIGVSVGVVAAAGVLASLF